MRLCFCLLTLLLLPCRWVDATRGWVFYPTSQPNLPFFIHWYKPNQPCALSDATSMLLCSCLLFGKWLSFSSWPSVMQHHSTAIFSDDSPKHEAIERSLPCPFNWQHRQGFGVYYQIIVGSHVCSCFFLCFAWVLPLVALKGSVAHQAVGSIFCYLWVWYLHTHIHITKRLHLLVCLASLGTCFREAEEQPPLLVFAAGSTTIGYQPFFLSLPRSFSVCRPTFIFFMYLQANTCALAFSFSYIHPHIHVHTH